jgi:uroporphyrinogen-III decarboxylase
LHTDVPFSNPDHDLLVRVARGEVGERTPVWLMRQAGRYMADFRKYSDNIPFRERSETPAIAIELSLQCWRAYGMDGVIMFSDILTPLPAMGIEFDVVKGKGPVISNPPRDMAAVKAMKPLSVRARKRRSYCTTQHPRLSDACVLGRARTLRKGSRMFFQFFFPFVHSTAPSC